MYIDKLYNRLYSDKDALNVFLSEVKLFADKEPSFWQRHKGKILGAAALAALAAGAYGGYKYAQNQNDELNEMTNKLTEGTKNMLDKVIPEENKVKYTELDKQNDVNEYKNLTEVISSMKGLIANKKAELNRMMDEYDQQLSELGPSDDRQSIYDNKEFTYLRMHHELEDLENELHDMYMRQEQLSGRK